MRWPSRSALLYTVLALAILGIVYAVLMRALPETYRWSNYVGNDVGRINGTTAQSKGSSETHAASKAASGPNGGAGAQTQRQAESTSSAASSPSGGGGGGVGGAKANTIPAKIAWNIPRTLKVRESAAIQLRVTLDEERFADLAARVSAPGTVHSETAELSRVLVASLYANGFEIKPAAAQRQVVLPGKDAVWEWLIAASAPGEYPVLLTIVSEVDGEPVSDPFRRVITVKAVEKPMFEMARDFAAKNWDKLWTVVLAPIAVAILAWWRKRVKGQVPRGSAKTAKRRGRGTR